MQENKQEPEVLGLTKDLREKFTAGAICDACSGRLTAGSPGAAAHGVSIDSRTLKSGQAFFALKGERFDGHDFVPQALQAGASIIVASRLEPSWQMPGSASLVLVDDTTSALLALAGWHRGRLKGKVISVTGSCGKSTVKTMIASTLSRAGSCVSAQKSFNNRIGLSLTLLGANADSEFIVLEMGTNHPGEIDELARCAKPNAGLITCLGESHLEGLVSREGVKEAKAEMIPHLDPEGCLLLNADDSACMSLAKRSKGKVITFGFSKRADVRATDIGREGAGETFNACGVSFHLPLAGRHNVLNATAAIATCLWAGVMPEEARKALAEVTLPGLRFEKRRICGVTFIFDCYNSNPMAMRAALEAFLEEPAPGSRLVVCGDMQELGPQGPQLHLELGRELAQAGLDALVAVGPLARFVVQGWRECAEAHQRSFHVLDAEDACRPLCNLAAPGDLVLVKGSRGMRLERIVDATTDYLGCGQKEAAA